MTSLTLSVSSETIEADRARIVEAWRSQRLPDLDRALAEAHPRALDHPRTGAIAAVRAMARGRAIRVTNARVLGASAVLQELVAMNRLDAAKAFHQAACERFGYGLPGLAGLGLYLRHLPAVHPVHRADFEDDPQRDVQIVPAVGARGALLVFCGGAHRFSAPLNIIHRWFAALPLHLVYLRDTRLMFYIHGVASFGSTVDDSLKALERRLTAMGVTRIVCAGASAGTYGALQFGLRLGAEAVIGFSGPTTLIRIQDRLAQRSMGLGLPVVVDDRQPMAEAYRAAAVRPAVRLYYGCGHETDTWHASQFEGVAGVELIGLDESGHDVVRPLVGAGALADVLRWLVDSPPSNASGGAGALRGAGDR